MDNQITVCPMCPDCPDNCPVEAKMGAPDRNVGDMIFRQDAIDVTWEKMTYTEQWYVLTEVRRRLKALPSAQPEQKRGKWKMQMLPRGVALFYCSECGFGKYTEDNRAYGFCPNCGADMREESDNG
jgi:rubrerythrin